MKVAVKQNVARDLFKIPKVLEKILGDQRKNLESSRL